MSELADKIKNRLEELRVHLQADGGDMEIVEIVDKTVRLRLKGACGGCPMATMTIKNGLERILKEEIDSDIEIERVM
ncbi:NifU family protein [Lentisphaerota bacterium ZTH]|nr:NifU family protein [Lentisphaerota bacterium]WET06651.1 NifU family protein [Lentisphaerota bacterium ZTH]